MADDENEPDQGADGPEVADAEFDDLGGAGDVVGAGPDLDMVRDIQVRLSVELGRTDMMIQDVLELTQGKVIELDKLAGEPLDILVNNKLLARGEVVVVDDHFGIRVNSIIDPRARVEAMGPKAEAVAKAEEPDEE